MSVPCIFVFTGTSGSGRKTVAHRIGQQLGLTHVLSWTDRPRRVQERPDHDYRYVSAERFDAAERDGLLIESVRIGPHRYGIARRELEEALAKPRGLYVILNREGSDVLKRLYGDRVVRCFLYVDKQTVRERLEAKGTAYFVAEDYLDRYTDEVSYRKHCEYTIENVQLDRTVESIKQWMEKYIR